MISLSLTVAWAGLSITGTALLRFHTLQSLKFTQNVKKKTLVQTRPRLLIHLKAMSCKYT